MIWRTICYFLIFWMNTSKKFTWVAWLEELCLLMWFTINPISCMLRHAVNVHFSHSNWGEKETFFNFLNTKQREVLIYFIENSKSLSFRSTSNTCNPLNSQLLWVLSKNFSGRFKNNILFCSCLNVLDFFYANFVQQWPNFVVFLLTLSSLSIWASYVAHQVIVQLSSSDRIKAV